MIRYLTLTFVCSLCVAAPRYTAEYWAGGAGDKPSPVAMDAAGNLVGMTGNTPSKPFYWPAGGVAAEMRIPGAGKWRAGGMDEGGRVYLDGADGKIGVWKGGEFSTIDAAAGESLRVMGAGGDGLAVGFQAQGRVAALWYEGGKVTRLGELADDSRSVALAVGKHGLAVGTAHLFGQGWCGGIAETEHPGQAVYWKGGDRKPSVVIGPKNSGWYPQAGRAVNAGGVMVGSTSAMETKNKVFLEARAEVAKRRGEAAAFCEKDWYGTRAFVARGRKAQLLPVPVGEEETIVRLRTSGINKRRQIVGWLDGAVERAVVWEPRGRSWTAELLGSQVDGPGPAGCLFTAALANNDRGQIAAVAACGGRFYTVRLTPVGKR